MTSNSTLTLEQARTSWLDRQRLGVVPAAARRASLADIVAQLGWIPVGLASTAYIALFARGAITTRLDLDRAIGPSGALCVVPGPRGSNWLVPTADAPLARAFALADFAAREARIAALEALPTRDLEQTHAQLRELLTIARTPSDLIESLPPPSLRSLGDVGAKNGLTTVAALVLRRMWTVGEIQRIPVEGRADRPAARWQLDPRPRTVPNAAHAVDDVARAWLEAHAPLSLKAFAVALGVATGRATSAFRTLRPTSVEIDGLGGSWLVPSDWSPSVATRAPSVKLLPTRDPLVDHDAVGFVASGHDKLSLTRSRHVAPLVLLDGQAAGTWFFDDRERAVRIRAFDESATDAVQRRAADGAMALTKFVNDELKSIAGHAPPVARVRGTRSPALLDIEW